MSDIFLSYKSEDKGKAQIIAGALERKGYSVWWDRVIPPGRTFDEVIKEELDSAKCVLVLWSRKSVLSDWVKEEADKGQKRRILVPILIDEVEIPMGFGRIQTARLVDWQGTLPNPEFDLLLNSVAKNVGRLPTQKTEMNARSKNEPDISAQQPKEEAKRLELEKEEQERILKQRERKEPLPYKKFLIVIGILGLLLVGYLIYPAKTTGSISISSSPSGASIYLDGSYQGTTPMTLKSVIADSHDITLKRTGYQDLSQTIRVNTDEIVYVSPTLISARTPTPTTTQIVLPTPTPATTQIVPPTPTPATTQIVPTAPAPATNMEFILIPAGEFDMGSSPTDVGSGMDEKPVTHVKLAKAFYLGKYEVTQKQWRDVMGNNPSSFIGDNLPVESVSWNEVSDFIKKLNEKEGGNKYRLPSEAEWEYSARAGTTTRYVFGDDVSKLGEYAWYDTNSGGETHDVGLKKPNPWGLYDMQGNVWEWLQDVYQDSYGGAPTDGSARESGVGSYRINRGGSWYDSSGNCRSAYRNSNDANERNGNVGFRLVKIL